LCGKVWTGTAGLSRWKTGTSGWRLVGLRPASCRTFTRARVAEALPAIVDRFVEEAKKGSIAHAKLLTNLGGLDKGEVTGPKKRRGKSMVGLLMERLAQEPKE
jgi:hypothetical protein